MVPTGPSFLIVTVACQRSALGWTDTEIALHLHNSISEDCQLSKSAHRPSPRSLTTSRRALGPPSSDPVTTGLIGAILIRDLQLANVTLTTASEKPQHLTGFVRFSQYFSGTFRVWSTV